MPISAFSGFGACSTLTASFASWSRRRQRGSSCRSPPMRRERRDYTLPVLLVLKPNTTRHRGAASAVPGEPYRRPLTPKSGVPSQQRRDRGCMSGATGSSPEPHAERDIQRSSDPEQRLRRPPSGARRGGRGGADLDRPEKLAARLPHGSRVRQDPIFGAWGGLRRKMSRAESPAQALLDEMFFRCPKERATFDTPLGARERAL
jgi:hypothetical protein